MVAKPMESPRQHNSCGVGSFTGFPGAINADGSWNFTAYDPLSCGGCGWGDDIYEAKVWETSFAAAPHDMSTVIKLMGGDAFLARLDASFCLDSRHLWARTTMPDLRCIILGMNRVLRPVFCIIMCRGYSGRR